MSSRDQRLAAKYAAQGKKSATETAREREATRASQATRVSSTPSSSVPSGSGGGVMAGMRRALSQPRTQESRDRAAAHKKSLPPLG